ncbi:Respiratory supercomplex factor 1, mitochondrial [Trichophyton interdigitale]|uniref:Respiratory supercomplex factor 1, mitochondrial n=1 Tax=Trichophyton interdigitale TaxID=101480 RepID=A0A9P5D080_9EURO|nr:Respiratory supercomplex factor 1, mitochondrial [Trichophyton interdigitale]KAF3898116.1 Respiratory supercomplex factor 1, mitochondrial [Trichophyton interdigitale]KAG8210332.1 Respiratory supercomplex factor 1, mitochondrial [Trichophyton interdigitale]
MSDKPLPSSFDDDPDFFQDNSWKKLGRRLKEEPLVPLGESSSSFAIFYMSSTGIFGYGERYLFADGVRGCNIGIGATCYALFRAYRSMKMGDSVQVNRMFRARIYAQAFTLLAVCAGSVYYKTERDQRKQLEKAMDLKKQQAKRDAWLKELEIREQEDKDWQSRHATIEQAAKGVEVKPFVADSAPDAAERDTSEEPAKESGDKKDGSSGGVLSAVKNLSWGSK